MTRFSLSSFTPVADEVYVAVAEPTGVNIGLVVGPSASLVIDTGSSPAQGAAIRAAAEDLSGVPVGTVLVTHWHYDHLFGLSAFAGLPAYAHESVIDRLAGEEVAAQAADVGVNVAELAAPDQLFSLAKVIDAGGRRVEALHFGPGHSEGDVVVYVPDAQVIFAGDLLESSGPPSFGPDCHLKNWPSALDGILGLVAEETVIVPGHGEPMDRLAAFTQRAEISGFYGQVEHLISKGVAESEAYASGEWPFDEATVTAALPVAYAQLAPAGFVGRKQLPLLGGHS